MEPREKLMFEKFVEVLGVVHDLEFEEFCSVWCVVLESMSAQNGKNINEVAGDLYTTIRQMNKAE